ncbi:MAG: hypothetical protein IPJ98_16600 [Bryobacterales bacterium]|nr:hypothetical protein [Bryobacterales bacterium]
MLELAPSDPIIKAYLRDLAHLKRQGVSHELGLKAPFQTLLDKAAKKRGWLLVPEQPINFEDRRIVPDGTIHDELHIPRGWWEAKDPGDKLADEISRKLRAGYPTRNTIFEDTPNRRPLPGPRHPRRIPPSPNPAK